MHTHTYTGCSSQIQSYHRIESTTKHWLFYTWWHFVCVCVCQWLCIQEEYGFLFCLNFCVCVWHMHVCFIHMKTIERCCRGAFLLVHTSLNGSGMVTVLAIVQIDTILCKPEDLSSPVSHPLSHLSIFHHLSPISSISSFPLFRLTPPSTHYISIYRLLFDSSVYILCKHTQDVPLKYRVTTE